MEADVEIRVERLAEVVLEIQRMKSPLGDILDVERLHFLAGNRPDGVSTYNHPEYLKMIVKGNLPTLLVSESDSGVQRSGLVVPGLDAQPFLFLFRNIVALLDVCNTRIKLRAAVEDLHLVNLAASAVDVDELLLVNVYGQVVKKDHPPGSKLVLLLHGPFVGACLAIRFLAILSPILQRHGVEMNMDVASHGRLSHLARRPAGVRTGSAAEDGPVRTGAEDLEATHCVVIGIASRELFVD
mmetsp:Transcript_17013/g.38302  ORF Transcript_17013/g.38302 Transcript_17013/m.38302 type:complete len:241 (-) Transcript_17013:738-1460(-)